MLLASTPEQRVSDINCWNFPSISKIDLNSNQLEHENQSRFFILKSHEFYFFETVCKCEPLH